MNEYWTGKKRGFVGQSGNLMKDVQGMSYFGQQREILGELNQVQQTISSVDGKIITKRFGRYEKVQFDFVPNQQSTDEKTTLWTVNYIKYLEDPVQTICEETTVTTRRFQNWAKVIRFKTVGGRYPIRAPDVLMDVQIGDTRKSVDWGGDWGIIVDEDFPPCDIVTVDPADWPPSYYLVDNIWYAGAFYSFYSEIYAVDFEYRTGHCYLNGQEIYTLHFQSFIPRGVYAPPPFPSSILSTGQLVFGATVDYISFDDVYIRDKAWDVVGLCVSNATPLPYTSGFTYYAKSLSYGDGHIYRNMNIETGEGQIIGYFEFRDGPLDFPFIYFSSYGGMLKFRYPTYSEFVGMGVILLNADYPGLSIRESFDPVFAALPPHPLLTV